MEKKNEDIKAIHSQHARILKEEDDIWISSEDLNTENSSDDDKSKSKQAHKKKLKLKHRKRSSPNIILQRPSISSIPSTSTSTVDERLLIPKLDDHHSRSDDSRTSDEEFCLPPISSECLSKRLSLEDWRPMKGALKISSLEEAASTADETRKIANESNNFFNVMLYKLKDLKSCPVLNSARKEKYKEQEIFPDERKTFKYLKNTPEVKQKLSFINKMEEEICDTIDRYKVEREERFKTEFEMCKTISENKLSYERDVDQFLEMCNFEEKLKMFKKEAEESLERDFKEEETIQDTDSESLATLNGSNHTEENEAEEDSSESSGDKGTIDMSRNFIRRNIYAARHGMMANFSLTDEEKTKIADILKDIDDFQLGDADLTLSSESLTGPSESYICENTKHRIENDTSHELNAFYVRNTDRIRMGEINNELEKFAQDEELTEKSMLSSSEVTVVKDEEFWKQYVLDQLLKDIDAKLEKLYESYVEDEEKLKSSSTEEEISALEVSN